MRTLLSCLFALAVCAVSQAAITVATSTSAGQDGDEITLTGCGFGTNDLDIEWFDAESETLGTKAAVRQNAVGWPEGWQAVINTNSGLGNLPVIDDYTRHAGQRAIRANVYNNVAHTSNLQYLPSEDSGMGLSTFDEVFVSFWANIKPCDDVFQNECPTGHTGYDPVPLNNEGNSGHWKFLAIQNTALTNHDASNSTQEGGYYIEIFSDWQTGHTLSINPSWGFGDESRADCFDGDPCPGDDCWLGCQFAALPNNATGTDTYIWPETHYEWNGNTHGDQDSDNEMRDVNYNDVWTKWEVWWQFSSDLGERDASHRVRVFQAGRDKPVDFFWDTNFISHLDSVVLDDNGDNPDETLVPSVWEPVGNRVNFMGYLGHRWMSASIFYDDIFIQLGSQARVELGNKAVYSECSLLETQVATAWADDEVVFDLNLGNFAELQWLWLYVVAADGTVNELGRPIWIGETVPDDTENRPWSPKDPDLSEGLGG